MLQDENQQETLTSNRGAVAVPTEDGSRFWEKGAVKKLNAVAIAVFLAASASVHAQSLDLSGILEGDLPGQELVGAFPFSDVGQNYGTISTWVVDDPTLNSQGYTFIYQAINSGIDPIDQVELTGFANSIVLGTATYSSLTGSLLLPDAVTPDLDGNFLDEDTFGNTATFEKGELNNGGTPSYFFVVKTNVRSFDTGTGQIQDDFTAGGNIYAPVPEPSTTLVFLTGLVSLYGLFRFRRAIKAA